MGNNPTYVNCSNNCYYQFSQWERWERGKYFYFFGD
jgi:hypothetical protein